MKLFWIITFIVAACGASDVDMSSNESTEFAELLEIPETGQSAGSSGELMKDDLGQTEKKLRKNGSLFFQSQDLESDYKKIKSLLPRFKAYVSNENQFNDPARKNYQLNLRVESAYFDSLMVAISGIAWKIESKTANVDDVTRAYYDLKTRIENKKVLEQRYREILTKANEVKDILEIEKSINTVREEIELMQQQFNALSRDIQYSSLDVQFYEELPYEVNSGPKKGFGNRILNALSNGWSGLLTILVGLVTIWPIYLLGLALFVLIRFLTKKVNPKQ